jgi:hypothetical protein
MLIQKHVVRCCTKIRCDSGISLQPFLVFFSRMLSQHKLRDFGGPNVCHMRRFLTLTVRCLLIVCLLLTTTVSGFFGAAHDAEHDIAQAGQSTLVICGQDGASMIMLDRNGTPVNPESTSCKHCADCSLVSVFDLPVITAIAPQAARARSIARDVTDTILISGLARYLPSGPPTTFRS